MAGCVRGHVWEQGDCWSCQQARNHNENSKDAERRHKERMNNDRASRNQASPSSPNYQSGPGFQLPSMQTIKDAGTAVAIIAAVIVVGVLYLVGSLLLLALAPIAGIAAVIAVIYIRTDRPLPERVRPLPEIWWIQLAGLGLAVMVADSMRPDYGPANSPIFDVYKFTLVALAVAGIAWLTRQARGHLSNPGQQT